MEMNKYYGHPKWHEQQLIFNEKQKLEEEFKQFKKPFFFITINPKPDTDFNEFKSAIEDISTFCWIEKCYWVFEQRGNNNDTIGNGFHSHILIEKHNCEFGKMKQQITNKMKKFVGVVSDNTINIQKKNENG